VAKDFCGLLEIHQTNTGILHHQIGPALYVLSSLLLLKSPYHSALLFAVLIASLNKVYVDKSTETNFL